MDNKQTITFEGKKYLVEEQSADCLEYLQHLQNLNTKLAEADFTAKQLRVALTAFTSMFRNSLTSPVEVDTLEEESNADQEVQDNNG
jgi:hypothetical protein